MVVRRHGVAWPEVARRTLLASALISAVMAGCRRSLSRQQARLGRRPCRLGRGHGPGPTSPPIIKAALAPACIGFVGAAQVAQLRPMVTKNGKKTVYLITSDRDADPATLAAWVRSH